MGFSLTTKRVLSTAGYSVCPNVR